MAKIVAEQQKDFATLPDDSILHLKVDEITIKNVDGRNGPWEKMEVKFKVLGIQAIGDGSDPEDYEDLIAGPIWGSVPFRLTDGAENKLRLWTEAILGIEVGEGFELDTDVFLNRKCRGVTSTYNKRSIDPATNQPFKGHQIASLLPMGGDVPQQAAPQGGGWSMQNPPQPQAQVAQNPWGSGDEPPF